MTDHAHHIPATDYHEADWENGTLARINRPQPGFWFAIPFIATPFILLALVAYLAWGMF